jgi:amino acid transporter
MAQASLDTIASAGGEGSGLFLRKATGLVREISGTDAFLINAVGMNVGLGALFMLLQAPAFFPSGNMVVATIIGTLLMAFTITWVYSEFSAAMPRSGGDYVFTSRTIHPFVGWILGWNQAVWLIFFWIGFNAWAVCTQALPTFFSVLAQTTGVTTFSDWASTVNTPAMTFVIGTLINIMFALLVLSRRYWGWQRITLTLAIIAVLIPAVLIFFNASGLTTAWDDFVAKSGGIKFADVIPSAEKAGYTLPSSSSGFDLTATLLMLPWVFFVVGFGVAPAQLGGEVKRAGQTMWYALFGAVLFNGLLLALIVWMVTTGLGLDWVGSLAFLASQPADANALQGLPVTPGINFLGSIMTGVIGVIVIGLGFVAWSINGTPASELQATRYMLAGALDRMVPGPLGEVDERFHSPRNAIIVCTVGGELAILALIAIPQASLLGALLAQLIAYIIVGIAGIIFPFRMRDVWKAAGGRQVAGIPLISIAGLAAVVVLGAMMFNWITNDTINGFFGVTRDISLMVTAFVVGTGVLWYLGAWYFHRSRGFDTTLVYKAIPPE